MGKEYIVAIKIALAGIVAFFGNVPVAYVGLVGLMSMDFLLGFLIALDKGEASAAQAGHGLVKKLTVLVLLGSFEVLLFVISTQTESVGVPVPAAAFSYVGTTAAVWFCIREVVSIMEFADYLKIPIPQFMRDGLAKLSSAKEVPIPDVEAGKLSALKKPIE